VVATEVVVTIMVEDINPTNLDIKKAGHTNMTSFFYC